MADLIRWEPFGELANWRRAVDRMFDDSLFRPYRLLPELTAEEPALDVYQTGKDVVVKASLPGIKPEEVDVSITEDMLIIKGEHGEGEEVKEADYFRKERRYGAFQRSMRLPVPVQTDKAEATFEDGVLTLTLPKIEEIKPKQIKVKAKAVSEGKK